jgi:hypothetical protein
VSIVRSGIVGMTDMRGINGNRLVENSFPSLARSAERRIGSHCLESAWTALAGTGFLMGRLGRLGSHGGVFWSLLLPSRLGVQNAWISFIWGLIPPVGTWLGIIKKAPDKMN